VSSSEFKWVQVNPSESPPPPPNPPIQLQVASWNNIYIHRQFRAGLVFALVGIMHVFRCHKPHAVRDLLAKVRNDADLQRSARIARAAA